MYQGLEQGNFVCIYLLVYKVIEYFTYTSQNKKNQQLIILAKSDNAAQNFSKIPDSIKN